MKVNLLAVVLGLIAPIALSIDAMALGNDCNGNGIPDDEDISNGTSADCNQNGIPDECEIVLVQDFDGSGFPPGVTESFIGNWQVTSCCQPAGDCGQGNFVYLGDCGPNNCDTCNLGDVLMDLHTYTLHGVQMPSDPAASVLTFCYAQAIEMCAHDWAALRAVCSC